MIVDYPTMAARLNRLAARREFQTFLSGALLELCALPSVPDADPRGTAVREERVYEAIARLLKQHAPAGEIRRLPIPESIRFHPSYTRPYYAGGADPAEVYRDRGNLVYVVEPPVAAAKGVALNAHIDTVAPFFSPRREGDLIFGRGACDDKGCCVAILGALRLLRELREQGGKAPARRLVAMFVTEEETGGNGSLALVRDAELGALYDTVLVLEATGGQLHPAGRGAVWYRAELPGRGPGALRLALETVRELELAGRRLREESAHPLFPDRPVQTCHGMLGPFGEHPSRICGRIAFRLRTSLAEAELAASLEKGLGLYLTEYGDKTRVIDPVSGRPKVARHYDLEREGDGYRLTVWGRTGHMGSVRENDGAITKAAFMLTESLRRGDPLEARLAEEPEGETLVLEGGQGFLPTHGIEEVQERVRAAARVAAARLELAAPRVTFDKLHNAAFDGDPDSPAMRRGLEAAELLGRPVRRPIMGLGVSCDARLFALEPPGREVITVGPGSLAWAHSDDEQLDLGELADSCAFLALYLLMLE